jgi:hypothetical protein
MSYPTGKKRRLALRQHDTGVETEHRFMEGAPAEIIEMHVLGRIMIELCRLPNWERRDLCLRRLLTMTAVYGSQVKIQ